VVCAPPPTPPPPPSRDEHQVSVGVAELGRKMDKEETIGRLRHSADDAEEDRLLPCMLRSIQVSKGLRWNHGWNLGRRGGSSG